MKLSLFVILCALVIANALPVAKKRSRLPLPEVLQEKYGYVMEDDPPEMYETLNRIVGGGPVASGGRPYQIALERSGSFTCGGSWISSRTVLTAAHCVDGVSPNLLQVRYNTLIRTSGPVVAVTTVNRHPNYSSSTIDNDVATLIVASAFTPGTNAAIVTLVAAGSDPNTGAATVSGWGRLTGGGALPNELQQADLNLMDRSECSSRWGSTNAITTRMICAHDTSRSACNGDSGGPFTVNNVQQGVVSWGSSSCLHATLPNVYANVGTLRDWIDANTVS